MTVFVCVDKKMGVLFQGKRQSKDRMLRKRILDIVESANAKLTITNYSYEQFRIDERDGLLNVQDKLDFKNDDYVFVEDEESLNNLPWENIDELVLCCWERNYPADTFLHKPEVVDCTLKRKETVLGNSHDMTLEFYNVKTRKKPGKIFRKGNRRSLKGNATK